MEIKKLGSKIKTGETRLGVYVWEMPDGRWIFHLGAGQLRDPTERL